MCGFIHTLPTLWGWAFQRLRRLLRTNAYAAMHKMACFESAAIVSECEKITQGGRTVCYWYTKYPPGSPSASTVGGRRVCSQLSSHSVCGHSTIVAWCVRVIQQSSSSSLQTTIVGPTEVAWCVPSLMFSFINLIYCKIIVCCEIFSGVSYQYATACLKPGLYFERKSTAYTQTTLRTWGAFSRPPMPIYAVGSLRCRV